MPLPELARRAALLAIVAAAAVVPGNDPRAGLGSVFTASPCPSIQQTSSSFDFEESFVGVPKCEALCRQAASACKKAVKAAAACQLAFASDWTAFDSAVDCDGLEGADKKACKAGWAADLKTWRASIKSDRDLALTGLSACARHLEDPNTGCLRRCSGV